MYPNIQNLLDKQEYNKLEINMVRSAFSARIHVYGETISRKGEEIIVSGYPSVDAALAALERHCASVR